MASSSMPQPPGADGSAPQAQANPTSPTAVSPAPATPSPAVQGGTQQVLQLVSAIRALAKAYPAAAPALSKMNDIVPEVMSSIMQHQSPGEPAAPPGA